MPAAAIPNTWHLRTVAESAGKPCWICFKATSSVLITPDNKDYFYVCRGHLKDRTFCLPAEPTWDKDTAEKKKREAELQKEIEAIKKEYAEKQAKKKEKAAKDKDKGKDENKKEAEEEKKKEEQEKDEKIKEAEAKVKGQDEAAAAAENMPRIYSLHRNFYQMRLDRIRNAEIARRNRERLRDPSFFPSVPGGTP